MSDEYIFDLQERRDRNGKKFFFGSLRLYNAVMFIFPSDDGTPGEWKAVVRPYKTPKDNEF